MDEDYARRLRNWLRAEPEAPSRDEFRWLREIPAPKEPQESPDRWSVRGQLPPAEAEVETDATADAADDTGALAVVIPLPRPSRENGCRMSQPEARRRSDLPQRNNAAHPISEAEARSRRNHPSNTPRPEETAHPMSEAEARSRWNHPSNWHRRRRQAENPDEPGSR